MHSPLASAGAVCLQLAHPQFLVVDDWYGALFLLVLLDRLAFGFTPGMLHVSVLGFTCVDVVDLDSEVVIQREYCLMVCGDVVGK